MITRRSRSTAAISSSRWTAYATAGAATALVGAGSADAAIHHVTVNQQFHPAAGASSISSFTLGGTQASFALRAFLHSTAINGHASFAIAAAGTQASFVGYTSGSNIRYISKLAMGNNIAAHANWQTNVGYFQYIERHGYGQWGAIGDGFIGIRFNTGAGTQYGWIRLHMDSGQPLNQYTLIDYAYGDPGDLITAGQIPEPGSLGLLALGATGLLAWRKRRSQAA